MMSRLLSSEETSSAAVVALSAMVVALVVKGDGPLSRERLLARVLPDPVVRYEPGITRPSRSPLPSRIAA